MELVERGWRRNWPTQLPRKWEKIEISSVTSCGPLGSTTSPSHLLPSVHPSPQFFLFPHSWKQFSGTSTSPLDVSRNEGQHFMFFLFLYLALLHVLRGLPPSCKIAARRKEGISFILSFIQFNGKEENNFSPTMDISLSLESIWATLGHMPWTNGSY